MISAQDVISAYRAYLLLHGRLADQPDNDQELTEEEIAERIRNLREHEILTVYLGDDNDDQE